MEINISYIFRRFHLGVVFVLEQSEAFCAIFREAGEGLFYLRHIFILNFFDKLFDVSSFAFILPL